MSQRALCLAVRDRIRTRLRLLAAECDVMPPPGKPPAACGEFFVAVWENGWDNHAFDSRDDRHKFAVTLTARITFAPDDRVATEVIHEKVVGLEVKADQVVALIHGDLQGTGASDPDNYAIVNGANNYIRRLMPPGGPTVYGFAEPARFLSGSRTEEKNGDWFWGDAQEKNVGRALTLYFGEAKRGQSIFYQS